MAAEAEVVGFGGRSWGEGLELDRCTPPHGWREKTRILREFNGIVK